MQIIIDVVQSSDGRLAGTARPAGQAGEGRRFGGVMELIACLEQLCAATSHRDASSESDCQPCAQAPPAPAAFRQPGTEGDHHG
jgi:hypothetical protein